MKREKKMGLRPAQKAQLQQESVVYIQNKSFNASCIHANVKLDKLKLRRY